MSDLVLTQINQRWSLLLPPHRAERAEWWDGWEKERLDAMHRTIKPGDVVYDVGAEEGDLSALYASWVRGVCRACRQPFNGQVAGGAASLPCQGHYLEPGVVLFEPNPRVWPNIRAIFQGNTLPMLGGWVGFAGDVTTSDVDNEPRDIDDPQMWPRCAHGPVIADHGFCNLSERPDIPSITLDDYAYGYGPLPDVITIDSEGSELRVLRGAGELLTEKRPTVFVSVHPDFMREMYQQEPSELHVFMRNLGYAGEHLATDHEEHWKYTPQS